MGKMAPRIGSNDAVALHADEAFAAQDLDEAGLKLPLFPQQYIEERCCFRDGDVHGTSTSPAP